MKKPLRILYLEDNENDALLVQSALDQEGFECRIDRVETRADFAAALERDTYDIIFSDFTLPSYDGESALKLVTEKGIDIYKKSNEMKSDKTIMSVLTEAERQQLISIMKKVIRAAEKY